MIGAISGQVGVTDEKSDLLPFDPIRDRGFDKVLNNASHRRPGAAQHPKSEAEPVHTTRTRSLQRRDDSEPREDAAPAGAPGREDPPEEKVAGREAKSAAPEEASATPGEGSQRATFQELTPEHPPEEADTPVPYPDDTVLEAVNVSPEVAARQAQAANLSGVGRVAYQQSPHGLGEEAVAAEAGLALNPPAQRADSPKIDVAAQAVQAGEIMDRAEFEVEDDQPFSRKDFAGFVKRTGPERDPEALQPALDTKDAGRLAMLNAMRQPPPSVHPAHAAAMQGGLVQKSLEGDGEGDRAKAMDLAPALELADTGTAPGQVASAARPSLAPMGKAEAPEQSFVERVAQEVRWLIQQNRNEATIRLHPDHLGAMRIKVVQTGGTLTIEMTVDNPQARSVIESQLAELLEHLDLEDLGAEQFSFNVNVQQGGEDGMETAEQSSQSNPYAGRLAEPPPPEQPLSAAISRPVWGHAGVGVYA